MGHEVARVKIHSIERLRFEAKSGGAYLWIGIADVPVLLPDGVKRQPLALVLPSGPKRPVPSPTNWCMDSMRPFRWP